MLKIFGFFTLFAFASAITCIPRSGNDDNFERMADYDMVINGAQIDYCYNQSMSEEGGLRSVPGCPKSILGYPWLYYPSPATHDKCYLSGQRGPCEAGQVLFFELETPYGFCNCECFIGTLRSSDKTEIQFCSNEYGVEVAFHPEAKKCYTMYDQGPCNEGEWLVKYTTTDSSTGIESDKTRCEARRCPFGQVPQNFNTDKECDVPFRKGVAIPVPVGSLSSTLENGCPPNMKYSSLLRKCVKNISANTFG